MDSLSTKINKSLFNSEIKGTTYSPLLVSNTYSNDIQKQINDLLEWSDSFDISVSYIRKSGLQRIKNNLIKANSNCRILTTIDGYVTEPDALEYLLSLDAEVRVFNPLSNAEGFHMKSMIFKKNLDRKILLGSANFSATAFAKNYELNVLIEAEKDGAIVKQHNEIFEHIWNHSSTLRINKNFITNYREIWNLINNKNKYNIIKSMPVLSNLEVCNFEKFDEEIFNSNVVPNLMQEETLEKLNSTRLNNFKKGLVVAATGTGKTYLSAFDVKQTEFEKPFLFIVHSHVILKSSVGTFSNVFKDKKLLYCRKPSDADDIHNYYGIFCTQQFANSYLIKRLAKDHFSYIIIDEAHRAYAEKTKCIIDYFEPDFLLGMTATPERMKRGEEIYSLFDNNIVEDLGIQKALNNGLICTFNYYGIGEEVEDDGKVSPKCIKKHLDNNIFFGSKIKALVFVSNIKEAEMYSSGLNEVGINSVAVHSESYDYEEIDNLLHNLEDENNELNAIVAVEMFNEGVDIPSINCVIMIRQTKSPRVFLQQLGRGLRLGETPGKYVNVFDFIGNYSNNFMIAQAFNSNFSVDNKILKSDLQNNFNNFSSFVHIEIDKIAKERIFKSIDGYIRIDTIYKNQCNEFALRLGRIPTIDEFIKYNETPGIIDVIQVNGSYFGIYEKLYVKEVGWEITKSHKKMIKFMENIIILMMKNQDKETIYDLLNKGKTEFKETYLQKYILLDREDSITLPHCKFEDHERPFNLIDGDILPSDEMKKVLNTDIIKNLLLSMLSLNLNNENLQIGRMYDRWEVWYHLQSEKTSEGSMACQNQLNKNNIIFPGLQTKNDYTFFENKLVDATTLHYSTEAHAKNNKTRLTISILQNEFPLFIFVRRDKAENKTGDTRYYYYGTGKTVKLMKENIPTKKENSLCDYIEIKFDKPLKEVLVYEFNGENMEN